MSCLLSVMMCGCNHRSEMASCSEVCGSGHAVDSGCRVLGVRSYLHHFYEECTASMREQQEDFQDQRSPLRWSSGFWKVSKRSFAKEIQSPHLMLFTLLACLLESKTKFDWLHFAPSGLSECVMLFWNLVHFLNSFVIKMVFKSFCYQKVSKTLKISIFHKMCINSGSLSDSHHK